MRPGAQITAALRAAKVAGRPGVVAFLTAGFPHPARFAADLAEACEAADVVEIGVPFTDPMADGVTIQRASRAALAMGVSLRWILDQLTMLEFRPAAPVLLMSYLNPLLALGIETLAERAAAARVSGFIVPDLPLEESVPLRSALERTGLALVQLVTPVSTARRLRVLCRDSDGFVYAVTTTGITGGAVGAPGEMLAYLDRVREVSPLPVCAGFGIRSAEQVRRIGMHADGVVVGSALVEAMERGESPGRFLRTLRVHRKQKTGNGK